MMLASLLMVLGSLAASQADAGGFDDAVAPVLTRRCLDCHSGPESKGKLDLSRKASALAGGAGGAAIVPGKPEESPLWEKVEAGEMPPKAPLPEAERAVLRRWIASGAVWGTDPIDPYRVTTDRRAGRDWWSLQPVVRPEPPAVRRDGWARSPIDRFVLAKLEARGLSPAPEADRRTLIRRLSFDLTGLPPTPGEVDAFLADASPDAYERLVDRLLASPQYGVRWARRWLDLARYGESNGFEFDEFRPDAWRYRDWVVDALNRDLPYDEFARLQLAGDAIRPDDAGAVAATGFLVAGAYDTAGQNQQSEAMKAVVRGDELEDVIGAVGQTFLGLTVHCARCHDHKFDPIRQSEYYRLASALGGVRHGERKLPGGAKVYAVAPREAGTTHVQLRGNPKLLGDVVTPGGVASLSGLSPDFGLPADAPEAESRRRLASWVTDARNPLFGRAIVNRLWEAHVGAGIVETPSDFGFNGGRPSHPELLDWLAAELAAQDWSLKAIHRRIVTSAAYRQSSRLDPGAQRLDAGNRLLWRKSPQRLEAEMVRDAMLAVAGTLDVALGGPSFRDFEIVKAPGTAALLYPPIDPSRPGLDRRTLYRAWARGGRNALLDAFDCPDPSAAAPRRAVTTTPLQALALMNNGLVLHISDRFARRLEREAGPDSGRQVDRAYRLAFGRAPEPDERARAVGLVARYGPSALARAIFNSNEFLYVD
ncbi:MAG TPA: PSD1 and planctomycete cytochrome C domain-containing protein [Isosphaeraceae bacterium]|jgi:hypothetical protein|nr:PSD1 and planctomycete cytochrome C domain-containing protein [Isosphaeraceae bacterium]